MPSCRNKVTGKDAGATFALWITIARERVFRNVQDKVRWAGARGHQSPKQVTGHLALEADFCGAVQDRPYIFC